MKPVYAIQRYASRERYHPRPLPSYAVVRIVADGPAKVARWCENWDSAERWIAERHGKRYRAADRMFAKEPKL